MSSPSALQPLPSPRVRPRQNTDQFFEALAECGEGVDEPVAGATRGRQAAVTGGGLFAGRYRIHTRLARGGMGSIWSATDLQLGRPVAVKVVNDAVANMPGVKERFVIEARTAAGLRDPHVVQVYDAGIADGTPFLVMELLTGENLHDRLTRTGRMSLDETVEIARSICAALGEAHATGIVHRDLKPTNVFLAKEAGGQMVKLVDFGVAKMVDAKVHLTETGMLLGSPFYMSPEQVRAKRTIDARSDLWSLGVVLFRCLANVRPFEGTPNAVLTQIVTASAPTFSTHWGRPAPWFDAFFEKALQRRPDDRFNTASQMLEAFEAAIRSEQADRASTAVLFAPSTPKDGDDGEDAMTIPVRARGNQLVIPARVAPEEDSPTTALKQVELDCLRRASMSDEDAECLREMATIAPGPAGREMVTTRSKRMQGSHWVRSRWSELAVVALATLLVTLSIVLCLHF